MTIATILPTGRTVFLDANANPLSFGSVAFYIPNTTTPKTTWQDAAGVTANANPVILDGNGSALIYGSGQYTQSVYDVSGNLIYTALTQDLYGLIVNGNNTWTGTNTFSGTVSFSLGIVLPNDTVTNAQLANMNANTVKVNDTASIASPVDLALSLDNLLGRGSTGNIAPITLGTGLTMSGTAMSVSLSTGVNQQIIVGSGTWSPPAGYSSGSIVLIEVWGGGGGGAGESNNGGGGGGGSYKYGWFLLSGLGSSVSVTIGAGGSGGGNAHGGTGGTTSFGSFLSAYGGGGGQQNAGETGGSGGGFASAPSLGAINDTTEGWGGGIQIGATTGYIYATSSGTLSTGINGFPGYYTGGGGGGAVSGNGGNSVYGGGGGGAAMGGTAGSSVFGGAGGAGVSSGTAHAGTAPGGGGGGNFSNAGAAGAAGQCRVTVFA